VAGHSATVNHTSIIGLLAVIFATINVVGGYLVTQRMLDMFKKKAPRAKNRGRYCDKSKFYKFYLSDLRHSLHDGLKEIKLTRYGPAGE